jgi:DNA-binding GntR family transcriptional regulator
MASARGRSVLVDKLTPEGDPPSKATVLEALRRVILAGEVPPGSAIPLDDVAARLGVSRIPVREALMTLIGEGLVDHRPNVGYSVAKLTVDELRQLYVVRRVLENAALAAAVGAAGAEDFARAQEIYAALALAVEEGDSRAYQHESRRFHMALLAPAGMQRLRYVLESAWNVTEPCQPMAHVTAEVRRQLHSEHGAMLEAFLSHDTARVLSVSEAHHRRLEDAVAALPRDSGLFAGESAT